MDQQEYNELFCKTIFIEHLTEAQQTELFNVVKGLIKEQKVKEVIKKLFGSHGHCESSCPVCLMKKELGLK